MNKTIEILNQEIAELSSRIKGLSPNWIQNNWHDYTDMGKDLDALKRQQFKVKFLNAIGQLQVVEIEDSVQKLIFWNARTNNIRGLSDSGLTGEEFLTIWSHLPSGTGEGVNARAAERLRRDIAEHLSAKS